MATPQAHGEGQVRFGTYGTITCPPVKSKQRRKEQQTEDRYPQVCGGGGGGLGTGGRGGRKRRSLTIHE